MKPINETPFVITPMVVEPIPGRFQMSFVIKASYRLVHGGPCMLADEQQPVTGDERYGEPDGSLRYAADLVPFKPRADVMLAGKCYAPGVLPTSECQIGVSVGNFQKSLRVVGDRQWQALKGLPTEPEPFTDKLLCYESSWGGPQHAGNPVGVGQQALESDQGISAWPLPNFESLNSPIQSPTGKREPAGLGPIPITWEPRKSLAGTFDDAWLKTRWPGVPHDFDWGHFNSAPRDQQIEGYLSGNEPLVFENLHPQVARFESELPGVRVVCFVFVEKIDEAGQTLKSFLRIPMNLDTLWADVGQERLVLIWRGIAEVSDEKASEVKYGYLATERGDEPAGTDQRYYNQFKSAIAELEDASAVMSKAEAEAQNEQLRQALGPDAPTFPTDLARKDHHTQIAAVLAVAQQLEQASTARTQARLIEQGVDPEQYRQAKLGAGAQTKRAAGVHQKSWAQLDEMDRQGLPTHEARAELYAQGLGPEPPSEQLPITQENFLQRVQQGEAFQQVDLTHLDLTGLDLRGAILQGCYLAGVSLVGATLAGADLTGSLFGAADLSQADLTGASCANTDFGAAVLNSAKLSAANLQSANLEKCQLEEADLSQVVADKAIFVEANLKGATLQQGRFVEADFSQACLEQVRADQADLTLANLNSVQATGISLVAARMEKMRAILGAVFRQANLHQADGPGAVFSCADLTQADLSYARLPQSFFVESNLRESDLTAAALRKTRFCQADCHGATFCDADLLEADFLKADLTEADLSRVNGYSANFMQAVCKETVFDKANLEMTSLKR